MLENRKVIWDALCEMKDSYAVIASALASVDSVAKIFDTGGGFTEGLMDIYASVVTTSVSTSSNTNHYVVSLQGNSSATFASASDIVELASIEFGDAAQLRGGKDVGAGLYKLKWNNMFGGTVYRYLRAYTRVSGNGAASGPGSIVGASIGAGITYTAILSK